MHETELTTSVETVGPLKRRFEVEVSAAAVSARMDDALRGLQRRVRQPGFRPGKVPLPVIERLYGEQLRIDVIEALVREAYAEALVRHAVAAATKPAIVVEPVNPRGVLKFSATVEVRPEVEVSRIDDIVVDRPAVRITDEHVARVLGRLAESAAQLQPITDRTEVAAGDLVTVDVAATVDGRRVDELEHRDALVQAGEGAFPGALEQRLVGLVVGATADIEVRYPGDYANPAVAGKDVAFSVRVKGLGHQHVPPLDDAFARSQGKFETLADLGAMVRSRMEQEAEQRADAAVREAIVDELVVRHPIDAPDGMVDHRCDAMIDSLDVRLPPGDERQKTLATLRQELRPRAVRDVKAAILLDALAVQQSITVADDELAQRIDRLAAAAGPNRERARELYGSAERAAALRTQMRREKALLFVADRSKTRPVEAS
jgi:trigger factor